MQLQGRILVAEDEHTHQELLKALLEKRGLDVRVCADGLSVLEAVLKETFDLILMDLQLPKMSGFEATKVLRQRGVKTPIVAITVYSQQEISSHQLWPHLDGYIIKPINVARLDEVLMQFLGEGNRGKEHDPGHGAGVCETAAVSGGKDHAANVSSEAVLSDTALDAVMEPQVMAHEFMNDLPGRLDGIEDALNDSDMDGLLLLIHALKNSSDELGMDELVRKAAAVEYLVVDQQLDGLKGAVEALRTMAEKAAQAYQPKGGKG